MNAKLQHLKILTDQLSERGVIPENLDVVVAIQKGFSDVIGTALKEMLHAKDELKTALEALKVTQAELKTVRNELVVAKGDLSRLVQKMEQKV